MTNFIIYTQIKEWYGDADHVGQPAFGRYKMKGCQEFVFTGPDNLYLRCRDLIASFNTKYDRGNRFFRYEATRIDFYVAPEQATFIDGEILIPFTDPSDVTSLPVT